MQKRNTCTVKNLFCTVVVLCSLPKIIAFFNLFLAAVTDTSNRFARRNMNECVGGKIRETGNVQYNRARFQNIFRIAV